MANLCRVGRVCISLKVCVACDESMLHIERVYIAFIGVCAAHVDCVAYRNPDCCVCTCFSSLVR